MKRGFKTWAEEKAEKIRLELGLATTAPLPARDVSTHLKIPIVTPELLGVSAADLKELYGEQSSSKWSAITVYPSGKPLIIHNPTHAVTRQESDLMHELAHIICAHPPTLISSGNALPFTMREYDGNQEDEADWLAAALKVPRAALWALVKRGHSTELIATYFGCSPALTTMRRNRTGVDVQKRRWNARQPTPVLFFDKSAG